MARMGNKALIVDDVDCLVSSKALEAHRCESR